MNTFGVGDRVRIVNMTNPDDKILNGCIGTIIEPRMMFWSVRLDEENLTEEVRKCLPGDDDNATMLVLTEEMEPV